MHFSKVVSPHANLVVTPDKQANFRSYLLLKLPKFIVLVLMLDFF